MKSKPSFVRVLILLGVLFFQLVLIQGALFAVSYLVLIFGGYGQTGKILDALVLGISFSAGSFLAGWIALKFHWLEAAPKLGARVIGTFLGAYVPLLVAILIYPVLEPGNPFYSLSILGAIIGFHVPTWFKAG
jgi:hypothetical protein